MKSNLFSLGRLTGVILLPVLALVLAGCQSYHPKHDVMAQPDMSGAADLARLHIGDTVTITLSGPPTEMPPFEKPINEDGTITMDYIGRVQAAGKTPGELASAIHDLYVPKYYMHLDVTVLASKDRVYFVSGEVKQPGRMVYTGNITVSKAITSAGDLTDFADTSSIVLTRVNGDRYVLNLNRILSGKDPDPPVFPGDQIKVGRRLF